MRTIKFRAWDKTKKVLGDIFDFTNISNDEKHINLGFFTHFPHIDSLDNYEIMQFTGLLDKNGKEIYEKSIVDNDYEVNFIFPGYILKNIYNGDIITFQNYEGQLQITKEYSEL